MKKGFTLIELLAVIVILAIIAVIAVPIVLDIINDSKESATLRSADFYLKGVETSIATSTIKDVKIKDGTYKIMQDGNVCLGTFLENDCDGSILKVEIDGEAPNEGNITIESGEVTYATLVLENKTIKKTNEGKLVYATNLANYIKNLYNETKTATVNNIEYSLDESHLLMNDRLGSKDVDKLDGNIRYYGANPNNYIDIGDRDKDGNIIFWRIIGLFKDIEVTDEEGNVIGTEDLVKVIRADKLTLGEVNGFSWDYNADGSYDNNWNEPVWTNSADTIVAQGKSGVWTYRKWASGIAECWGSLGMTSPSAYTYALPFSFLTGELFTTVKYHDKVGYNPPEPVNGWVTGEGTIILYTAASGVSSSATYLVSVHVIGTWK